MVLPWVVVPVSGFIAVNPPSRAGTSTAVSCMGLPHRSVLAAVPDRQRFEGTTRFRMARPVDRTSGLARPSVDHRNNERPAVSVASLRQRDRESKSVFDTRERILDQLGAGEDGHAEFMPLRFDGQGGTSTDVEELAGELVGFANAEGGVPLPPALTIPVCRTGFHRRKWTRSSAGFSASQPTTAIHRSVWSSARHSCRATRKATDGFFSCMFCPDWTCTEHPAVATTTRVGSTKRDLTPSELARLFQQRGRAYVFDGQPVLPAAVKDLNRHRLEAFSGRSPAIPWLDLLRNTRVTFRDEDGVDRPTVAGLLALRDRADRLPGVGVHRSRLLPRYPPFLR